jgi:hypothetical protein
MSVDVTKVITLLGDRLDVARSRRAIESAALNSDVTIVSIEEQQQRLSTKLVVTVSGHPRCVREFHDTVRGDALSSSGAGDGDVIGGIVVAASVEGFRFLKRKWQGRNDPPLDTGPN